MHIEETNTNDIREINVLRAIAITTLIAVGIIALTYALIAGGCYLMDATSQF